MEARAELKFCRIAPRKVQIVLDLIRNKPVVEAEAILKYTPKAACEPLQKLLHGRFSFHICIKTTSSVGLVTPGIKPPLRFISSAIC